MQNAVYIWCGGFVATRLLAPADMEALWQDELFSDPYDDGAGWQFATVPGGSVLEVREEDGVAIDVWERPHDREECRLATRFCSDAATW